MPKTCVELTKVATNNLKGIDVKIPLGSYTVVTGVSGSGKSSLVFDTLYAESYRRFIESLSSYARQYMKALKKPEIADVENLQPAVAVKQNRFWGNRRSTVGSITEIFDFIQVIFGQSSEAVCTGCCASIRPQTTETMLEVLRASESDEVRILSAVSRFQNMKPKELKEFLLEQGFGEAFLDGEVQPLTEVKLKDLGRAYILIDSVCPADVSEGHLRDSIDLAWRLGQGVLFLGTPGSQICGYSKDWWCSKCDLFYPEPTVALFSFNSPQGVCTGCNGLGQQTIVDWQKVFWRPDLSIKDGAVKFMKAGFSRAFNSNLTGWSKRNGIYELPIAELDEHQLESLKFGGPGFEGIVGYFAYMDKMPKMNYRIHSAYYKKYTTCLECLGDRFKAEVLAFRVAGNSIAQVERMALRDLREWLTVVAEGQPEESVLADTLDEFDQRLRCLELLRLGYLNVDRSTKSLSGGEVQRIQMARSVGSQLTDTLYCLDEPTTGLHPRDRDDLFNVIKQLRDFGNTVVVVEHDSEMIRRAEHAIEIGPGAGDLGGQLVFNGPGSEYRYQEPKWETLRGRSSGALILTGATLHNLKGETVRFALRELNCVCGVSGSGKSSLVLQTLVPLVENYLAGVDSEDRGGAQLEVDGDVDFEEVLVVSQDGIGRSSRSNVATYLGIMTDIRKILANEAAAQELGLDARDFSFNSEGGRCETCKGLGTVVEDLSFLGELTVKCPACLGKRFQDKVLRVKHNGRSLIDILQLTVRQARSFFSGQPAITETLEWIIAMGLGYLVLGQETTSFSGGEAQRIKLLSVLRQTTKARRTLLIFDEPTTGLSDHDVKVLIDLWQKLLDEGHSLVVIEHHLGVVKSAGWVIELGPTGGREGGRVLFQGPVADLARSDNSVTAEFL